MSRSVRSLKCVDGPAYVAVPVLRCISVSTSLSMSAESEAI